MRRRVWPRNLKNEEAMDRTGPQRHKGGKKKAVRILPSTIPYKKKITSN